MVENGKKRERERKMKRKRDYVIFYAFFTTQL